MIMMMMMKMFSSQLGAVVCLLAAYRGVQLFISTRNG